MIRNLRISTLFIIMLLIVSACNAPTTATSSPTSVPPSETVAPPTPTPFPDTPAPPPIDAPIVETPAIASIHFLNSLDGWGVTDVQIVRTNDGGITWYNVTPPDVTETGPSVDLYVFDNSHAWLQIPDFDNYPNSGTLYRTSDGGITWGSNSVPFSRAHIGFLDTNNGWVLADLGAGVGSNAVAVYQTMDGGNTWDQTFINDPNAANAGDSLPLSGLKFGLAPLNMQTAWIYGTVYSSGTVYVYRTDDGGANWTQISLTLPPGAENAELGFEQMQFVSPTQAFLSMRIASNESQLAVYATNDSGNTWTLTRTLIPTGGSTDFISAEEAVIYDGSQFYVTRDAAQTWNIIPPNIAFGDTFAMMDFVNASTGWVITSDENDQRTLYRTYDGGATWSPAAP